VTELRGADTVLQLLLMSCRVMSRGAGSALIDHLIRSAHKGGRRIIAEFVPTPVNRIMLITLRLSGFAVIAETGSCVTLGVDPATPPPSRHTHVRIEADADAATR
jgi:predicted enzyme involved in methoxymalonyl-ACP biosynthesis